ncbi:staygreen family protein [Lentibacillus saliphilus]|uniref:staygreen family protein n=1 Tax=Lentibacillus saliphilus TaxID=2737028 RepID=UPI001C2FA6E8|nr:staygreen family protein [Lentibacillus saliphilus]
MRRFDPNKLFVEYREGVTATEPIIHRRYTLTHSDETGDLFLTIGFRFARDKINPMRDEVLGEWRFTNGRCVYHVYLNVDGPANDQASIAIRNTVFRRELPLALTAIRYGDRLFFSSHPNLDHCPIVVHFQSTYPQFNTIENWGTFMDYA